MVCSPAARFESANFVSVTAQVFAATAWMWVDHGRSPARGVVAVGSHDADEISLITPTCRKRPVSGLERRFLFTDSELMPSAVILQAPHSDSSWLSSNRSEEHTSELQS